MYHKFLSEAGTGRREHGSSVRLGFIDHRLFSIFIHDYHQNKQNPLQHIKQHIVISSLRVRLV